MACSKYLEQIKKQDSGFVQVLENLESPGILQWHYTGKSWKKVTGPGNSLKYVELE